MNTWRPEGWNNSYRNAFELQGRVDTELEYYGKCFEAGADAMLGFTDKLCYIKPVDTLR